MDDGTDEALAAALAAEAACVWHDWAGALVVAAAACVAGDDLDAVRRLPDPGERPSRVVLQRGHVIDIGGGSIGQLLRLGGARPVEIGAVDRCGAAELRAALAAGRAAAGLYVARRRGDGLLGLPTFVWHCREAGVPAIVAVPYREAEPVPPVAALDAGADLVVADGTALGGPPCGLVAGRADLVAACRLQGQGVGRPMRARPTDATLLAAALPASPA